MTPKPIITFLSDFGTQDGYVGAVKGVLKSFNDSIEIIDITHDIASYNIKQAAFTLLNYYKQYPKGTVHLAVVDPGVGSKRNVIILHIENYYFVGPDNGIFQYVMQSDISEIYTIDPVSIYKNEKGATFHARDIFAPIAARLAIGERAENIGKRMDIINPANKVNKIESNKSIQIDVDTITCDKFGNIIFDITKTERKQNKNQQIRTIRFKNFESNQIYDYYSQVTKGTPLFLWNSLGFLELAICEGNAMNYFHCDIADKVTIIFK